MTSTYELKPCRSHPLGSRLALEVTSSGEHLHSLRWLQCLLTSSPRMYLINLLKLLSKYIYLFGDWELPPTIYSVIVDKDATDYKKLYVQILMFQINNYPTNNSGYHQKSCEGTRLAYLVTIKFCTKKKNWLRLRNSPALLLRSS